MTRYPLNVNIHIYIEDEDDAIELCDELTEQFGLTWKRDMDAISDFLLGHIFADGDILASLWYFDEEAYVDEVLNRGKGLTIQFQEFDTVDLGDFEQIVAEAEAASQFLTEYMAIDHDVYVAGGHPV